MVDLHEIVGQLAHAIAAGYSELPYAVLGHSLGALIAFELLRELKRAHITDPMLFMPCGRRAPQSGRDERPMLHLLPDKELLGKLMTESYTSTDLKAALQDNELSTLFLPQIRSDLTVEETYQFSHDEDRLNCPIVAFGGADDIDVPLSELKLWGAHTSESFRYHVLPGSHHFLYRPAASMAQLVTREIRNSFNSRSRK